MMNLYPAQQLSQIHEERLGIHNNTLVDEKQDRKPRNPIVNLFRRNKKKS